MNIPNLLTIARIVMVPILAVVFMIPGELGRWLGFALFLLAAMTDYLDGYLARLWSQQTDLGRLLDPIADKVLVAAVILILTGAGDIVDWTLIPAIVILSREIIIAGLREYLAGREVTLHVANMAKWKTATQMIALALLLIGDAAPLDLPVHLIGVICFWVAAALTVITGYDYFATSVRHMTTPPPNQ